MADRRSRKAGAQAEGTLFQIEVECPVCEGHHRVSGTMELKPQPILFGGGPGSDDTHEQAWLATIDCPVMREKFEAILMLPVPETGFLGGVVIKDVTDIGETAPVVAISSELPAKTAPKPARDWVEEELAEWRKSSVSTARVYATAMLTTASGAVAVYFAVLKYLGFEQAGHGPWAWLLGLPPVLFVVSAGLFAFALRPSLVYLQRSEYVNFRAKRIRQMHARSSWGAALYGIGLLTAVGVFLWQL